MKMAKASEADLKMALELAGMLESFERGYFPGDDVDAMDNPREFDGDDRQDCVDAMRMIGDKLREGSLFRVVFGMTVLLDPKNEAIDHSCDYLDHHPKVRMHDGLVGALRGVMDTTPIRHAQAGLANGIGTNHPDGIAIKAAEDVLAKLGAA
jgi:hypothetical protein